MGVGALLARMTARRDYAGQLEHVEELPERPGRFAKPNAPLAEPLVHMLQRRGIEQLYIHQAAALDAARARRAEKANLADHPATA